MYCSATTRDRNCHLLLAGRWHADAIGAIQAELAATPWRGAAELVVAPGEAELDLSGAWVLADFLAGVTAAGTATRFEGAEPAALRLVARARGGTLVAADAETATLHTVVLDPALAVEGLGRRAVRAWELAASRLGFLGRIAMAFLRTLVSPRRWRPASIVRHVYDTGITAVPIAALIAFLIAVILAYMGAQQLRKFGADIFVVDLVTIGVLRELGVLLTAVIVAGRSGSAFAAEIGAMRLNEEIDALSAIGVDPFEVLVVPRLVGLVIALPLLTVIADAVGLAGGGLLCHALLDMPLVQYVNRAREAIASTTFIVGLVKAPVFAVLIAIAGTGCGLRVRGSSRDLGRLTTLAVVQAIFLVILADALFAVLFMEMDI
jgi:phospholipid/cholesterol/gamma-HCH transport system permease protein